MDAPRPRFAHIFFDGTVDTLKSSGITQENVTAFGVFDGNFKAYCFSGLEGVSGAQVTIDAVSAVALKTTAKVDLNVDNACTQVVHITDIDNQEALSGFYVLLY